ncbi:ion channel [Autumnicola musiva]|uniref:Ion channel n=1 Tax=Autumnicola musiva TaxID=3075589 RepID=A0ABU3D7P4_9FLAO|nr:ion channel [Zunongwangia sp. F117]MDT0677529.1 ion channel [Zunongwangia sp. F117]
MNSTYMEGAIYLVLGAILLILVIYDFFFTTLSGSGAGFITKPVSVLTYKITRMIAGVMGRRVYNFSGMVVNLVVLSTWGVLVWLGLYLLYSYDPAGIVSSKNVVATDWERLYFTGYTLSTLGLGDFKPVTVLFEILTSCFSFFGFIFFTSSMTYLLSVSSALINKRAISLNIQNLGQDPEALAQKILDMDISYSYQQLMSLQELIDRHTVNHQSYPVLHFYSHKDPRVCLSLNLTRLDEALNILLSEPEAKDLHEELQPLRSSISRFLNHINENYMKVSSGEEKAVDSFDFPYKTGAVGNEKLIERRKILLAFLKSERFNWEDVTRRNS